MDIKLKGGATLISQTYTFCLDHSLTYFRAKRDLVHKNISVFSDTFSHLVFKARCENVSRLQYR